MQGFLLFNVQRFLQTLVIAVGIAAASVSAAAQQPDISGVENAAPYVLPTGNVARGELLSIYGSNLATGVASPSSTAPATTLAGASVSIGGLAAPILFASPNQLDVQAPFEIPAGTSSVNLVVTVNHSASAPVLLAVVTSDPGMFYAQAAGGAIVAPVQTNTALVPAIPGIPIIVIASGMGPVNPAVPSGAAPPSGASVTPLALPTVTVDGIAAQVLSANYIGVGVYQIAVKVPAGVKLDPVMVVLGGVPTVTGATGATGPHRFQRRRRVYRRHRTNRAEWFHRSDRRNRRYRPNRIHRDHWCHRSLRALRPRRSHRYRAVRRGRFAGNTRRPWRSGPAGNRRPNRSDRGHGPYLATNLDFRRRL